MKILILYCLLSLTFNLFAQKKYVVSGIVKLNNTSGNVYLIIADEETNKIPMEGVKKLVLKPTNDNLVFKFSDVPKGLYTLKCFQDINGNGKLDKGMFSPKELWYLSWNTEKRFPPRWDDINFLLDKDKTFEIQLE